MGMCTFDSYSGRMNTTTKEKQVSNPYLSLNEYQHRAADTAIYPGQGELLGLLYVSLGLVNEAGEVGGKVKKHLRDDDLSIGMSNGRREAIKGELGGTLWYLAMVAQELDMTLSEIAQYNLDQLASRQERGVLGGDGDNR